MKMIEFSNLLVSIKKENKIDDFKKILRKYDSYAESKKDLFNDIFFSLNSVNEVLIKEVIEFINLYEDDNNLDNNLTIYLNNNLYYFYMEALLKKDLKVLKLFYNELSDGMMLKYENLGKDLLCGHVERELDENEKDVLKLLVKYSKNSSVYLGELVSNFITNYYAENISLNRLKFLFTLPEFPEAAQYINKGCLISPFLYNDKESFELMKVLTFNEYSYKAVLELNRFHLFTSLVHLNERNNSKEILPALEFFLNHYQLKETDELNSVLNKKENSDIKHLFITMLKEKLQKNLKITESNVKKQKI